MANTAISLLPVRTITTAVTGEAGDPYVFGRLDAGGLIIESIFDYGSGGTTAKVWIQTSLDGGVTWFDIANHAFTTADLSKVSAISLAIAPAAQAFTPAEATLADNTIIQGVLGDRIRTKITSTGTYGGSTTLAVWARLTERTR